MGGSPRTWKPPGRVLKSAWEAWYPRTVGEEQPAGRNTAGKSRRNIPCPQVDRSPLPRGRSARSKRGDPPCHRKMPALNAWWPPGRAGEATVPKSYGKRHADWPAASMPQGPCRSSCSGRWPRATSVAAATWIWWWWPRWLAQSLSAGASKTSWSSCIPRCRWIFGPIPFLRPWPFIPRRPGEQFSRPFAPGYRAPGPRRNHPKAGLRQSPSLWRVPPRIGVSPLPRPPSEGRRPRALLARRLRLGRSGPLDVLPAIPCR